MLATIAERAPNRTIVLSGDIHSNWVNDLRVDDRLPETPVVATEFVGTSLSSGGNGPREVKDLDETRRGKGGFGHTGS